MKPPGRRERVAAASQIKLVAGLGNPGPDYRGTRHNLGFQVVDEIARRSGITWKKKNRLSGWLGRGGWGEISLILVKPAGYINLSGRAVRRTMAYFNLTPSELLLIVDDVNLSPGRLRIRRRGGAGGHHGLESVIAELQSRDFARLRLGIGGGEKNDLVRHVLSRPGREEERIYSRAIPRAVEALQVALESGIEEAMQQFNPEGGERP